MAGSPTKSVGSEYSPWKAKTVWVALAVMLIAGGLWIRDHQAAHQPAVPTSSAQTQLSDSSETPAQPGQGAQFGSSAPAAFRFGASYVGGFFLGWTLRRFLRWTLLVSGAAVLLVALGKKFGWFELDWVAIESHVHQSLAWARGEAGAFKQFVTGYLPSAGAAAVGAFLGFRRK